nr:putative late blight resistance protein homolog R1B-17 [Ipomoea batatas]
MPSGIADLIHLRYLALNTIGSLYKFRLFKLQNLQTLAICSWMEGYPLQLPLGILDLPQLRHLHLERKSSQCLSSLVRGNLLTLYWLRVGSLYERPNFRVVPNLKELGIYVEEWEPTKRGFRGLKVLLIERLDLKHWNANAEHFPALELLILRHCWDLKRVPVTFANIKILNSIVIEDCYSSLVTSAHNIANKVQRKRDGALRIRDLGTKICKPVRQPRDHPDHEPMAENDPQRLRPMKVGAVNHALASWP